MSDDGRSARTAGYASLVSALLAVRTDPASSRFDAELAAAEAAGTVDPAVARTLRWWQRESVRGVEEHLTGVLPGVLTSLATAESAAVETVASSATAWAGATGSAAGPPARPKDPGPAGGVPAGPETPPGSGSAGAARPPVDPGGTPHLRPVDVGPAGEPTAAPAHSVPRRLRPGFAPGPDSRPTGPPTPPSAIRPADPVAHDSGEGGAPPRRLLVAGLTVLTDEDRTSRGAAATDRSQHERTNTTHDDVPGIPG